MAHANNIFDMKTTNSTLL